VSPILRLARIELQLVMRSCTAACDIVALARTCRYAFSVAQSNFAWDECPLARVSLGPGCVPSARSLLRFARVNLCVTMKHIDPKLFPVPRRCRMVHVQADAGGISPSIEYVRALCVDPGLFGVTMLHIISQYDSGLTTPDVSPWVVCAARAFPELTELRVGSRNGGECEGVFSKLTRLHLSQSHYFQQDLPVQFGAHSLPALRELSLNNVSAREMLHVLKIAPIVQDLRLASAHDKLLPGALDFADAPTIDWKLLWETTQHVRVLHMYTSTITSSVLVLLAQDDSVTRMPSLETIVIHESSTIPHAEPVNALIAARACLSYTLVVKCRLRLRYREIVRSPEWAALQATAATFPGRVCITIKNV
jgi:hypothetical protein